MIGLDETKYLKEYIIDTRRRLHMHPEIGFDVEKTHDFVVQELKRFKAKIIHEHVGKNSVVAVIGNHECPVIGLRADMDALPLEELNRELEYCSTVPGHMHACGHDAHTAMLLGAARFLLEHPDKWHVAVKLIFQEAEEGPSPGGAKGIVDSGVLTDVESFFALHVSPEFPTGTFAMKKGPAFASVATLKIKIHGKGGHAAYPQLTVDPILIQAVAIQQIQAIVSRQLDPLDPAVISITQVHAGTTHNIIPETVYLEGTVRTFSRSTQEFIKTRIETILNSLDLQYGSSHELDFIREYDALYNSETTTDYFRSVCESTFGTSAFIELERPGMGAEDFFRYIELSRGSMAWLGTKKDAATSYGLHHPRFNIDEDALIYGTTQFINLVCNYERSNK